MANEDCDLLVGFDDLNMDINLVLTEYSFECEETPEKVEELEELDIVNWNEFALGCWGIGLVAAECWWRK